jgi:hypothetical protein
VGTYTDLKVTLNGCDATLAGPINITGITAPTLTAGTPTNPTTCSGTNGNIPFTTNLANGPYTLNYTKSGAAANVSISVASGVFTLSNLTAGAYTDFSITNAGCNSNDAAVKSLVDPNSPSLTAGTAVNPSTCSGTNGSIPFTTNLADGTYTLNYTKAGAAANVSINVASSAFTLSNLTAGVYTAFSITRLGCTGNDAAVKNLSDPTAPTLTSGIAVNPSVCAGSNGNIPFTTNLADGTYTLNYTKGGTATTANITVTTGAFTLSNLTAGAYADFSITRLGCTGTDSDVENLSDPNSPSITLGNTTNPATCSSSTGSIALNGLVANTVYSVSYKKDGGSAIVANLTSNASGVLMISSLGAGAYSEIRVVLNSCTSNALATSIINPSTLTFSLGAVADPTFCGGLEGSIALNGLTPNTTYGISYRRNGASATMVSLVSNANGVLTIPNLGSGSYTDITPSLNACTSNTSVAATLYNPGGTIISLGTLTNPSTCGGANGSIALNGLKANTLYSVAYNKDNAPTTVASLTANDKGILTIPNLSAASYINIRVTINACPSSIVSANLISPTTPVVTSGSVRNPSTCGNADGHIILNGLTANTVYSASYKKDGATAGTVLNLTTNANGALTIANLGAGAYSDIRVTLNACQSLALSFTLANPAKIEPVVSANSPVSQGSSIQLSVSVAPSYSWKGPEGFSSTSQNPSIPNAQLINMGTYTVTTGGDCGGTATVMVGVNASTTVSTTTTTSTTVIVTPPGPPVPPTCSISIGNKYPSVASSSGKIILAVNQSAKNYAWVYPNGFTSKEQSVTVFRPDGSYSGVYNVTATFENGCTATASTSITVTGATSPPVVVIPTPPVETPPAVTTPSSALTLKLDAVRTASVGSTVRMAVLVANPSTNPSAVATLNITLPAGLTFANGEGFTASGQTISRSVSSIKAGEFNLYFINVTVNTTGILTTQGSILGGASTSFGITATAANSRIGVEENTIEMSMNIAPNPSQGMMEVVINLSEASTLSLRLTDLMGREISTQYFEQADNQHRSKIDLTQHQVGMYLLTAQTNGKTISKKVLKVE